MHHCAATARGVSKAFLVGDLPFGSCLTPEEVATPTPSPTLTPTLTLTCPSTAASRPREVAA